ncbi:MAG: hypothetical protein DI635_00290 [Pseudoxanthomonas suwonensis]|nr:MAG: hypothetical protein DI635_00290 [Pseudoxanthomonas suwonensis]
MTRPLLRNSSLSLAIAMALSMPIVHAQDGDATEQARTEATELDAVQVTARRRSESIQDVPVAVSAFGEEALKDLQASNIDGLQGAVPNMNIVQGRGSSNSVNVFIRGIGQPDALQTFDPGVGMYVDDVYYSRINGALFSLFDVQQVEVLRGPQGTLYGKNSTGGAIKINTKNPFNDEGRAEEPSWTLKSITAWRALQTSSFIDIDASQFELGEMLVALEQKQVSQELQVQYDDGDNLQMIFGAYCMNEQVPSYQEAYADDLFSVARLPVSFLRTINDDLETRSAAAFAHATWEFVPSWTLSGGLRYSRDTKDYWRTTSTFWGPALRVLNETVAFEGRQTWDAWTPSLSLQKGFSDNLMAYVSANRGFKSGGFNGRANSALETTAAVFDPEFVWTYEAGVKFRSDGGRYQANVTAFRSNYEDFQARVSEVLNPDSPTPTFSFPVLNAAEMVIDGVELEGVAMLGEATRLSGQIGWMDARYERFDDLRTTDPANPAYNPTLHEHVPFSPEWTARLALQHTFADGDGGCGRVRVAAVRLDRRGACHAATGGPQRVRATGPAAGAGDVHPAAPVPDGRCGMPAADPRALGALAVSAVHAADRAADAAIVACRGCVVVRSWHVVGSVRAGAAVAARAAGAGLVLLSRWSERCNRDDRQPLGGTLAGASRPQR